MLLYGAEVNMRTAEQVADEMEKKYFSGSPEALASHSMKWFNTLHAVRSDRAEIAKELNRLIELGQPHGLISVVHVILLCKELEAKR